MRVLWAPDLIYTVSRLQRIRLQRTTACNELNSVNVTARYKRDPVYCHGRKSSTRE